MYYTKELCQNKEKTENTDILHSFLRIRIAKKKGAVLLFEKIKSEGKGPGWRD